MPPPPTCLHIADMIEAGYEVNHRTREGPQVGFILRRSEIGGEGRGMHEVPLDVCGADTRAQSDTLCSRICRTSSGSAASQGR